MNFLERAIAAVSPRIGAQRAYYRTLVEQSRAYEAAKVGRRTDGWYSPATGANAEIGPAAAKIRARVHDLVRNDPHAAPIPRKWASKIVGTGIQPRLMVRDGAFAASITGPLGVAAGEISAAATRSAQENESGRMDSNRRGVIILIERQTSRRRFANYH